MKINLVLLITSLIGITFSATSVFALRSTKVQENSKNITATEFVEMALKKNGGHLSRPQIKNLIASLPPLNAEEKQRAQSIYEKTKVGDISTSCSSCINSCMIENADGVCCNNQACIGGYCSGNGTCIGRGSSRTAGALVVCAISCI